MLLAGAPEVIAPDVLPVSAVCVLRSGELFAHFELAPGQVSQAVSHGERAGDLVRVAATGRCGGDSAPRREITDLAGPACA